ncbi:hypothetical protein PMAYCL1PPCAC_06081 [Pristionchus mayeri]|uniref:Uncharacterized protein n=1 Tax=Pristionchus mayeri TaxID=1317129 RepID=A0AAN5CC47_9BILA|nr:hypothetical protein PMAYCL1PPCAC_06081 [Pristionchus mayeri]
MAKCFSKYALNSLLLEIVVSHCSLQVIKVSAEGGKLPNFNFLSDAIFEILKIGRKMKPLNKEEEKFKNDYLDKYAFYKMSFPFLLDHLLAKRDAYVESELTKEQIRRDLGKSTLELIDKWHEYDPEAESVEVGKKRIREQ